MTASGQPSPFRTNFRLALIGIVVIAVIVLAIYVWSFLTAQVSILNLFGVGSFFLLMLCPIIVAFQAVRLTFNLQTECDVAFRDCVQASLRRSVGLFLIDALIAIPVFVLFSLFLQMEFAAFFSDAFACGIDNRCPPGAVVPLETFFPQVILVLIVALGLWGLNLLASVLGAWLALRWERVTPAVSGTIVALTVTVAVIYTLLSLIPNLPQVPIDLVIALLPYILTWAAWRSFAARTT